MITANDESGVLGVTLIPVDGRPNRLMGIFAEYSTLPKVFFEL